MNRNELRPHRGLRRLVAGAALAATVGALATPSAHAGTCDSPVEYSKDAKSTKWIHSTACNAAGDLLSSVGQAALGAALSYVGMASFLGGGGDSFAQYAEQIIDAIEASRAATIAEIDGLWQELRDREDTLQEASYSALLDRSKQWTNKTIAAKLYDPGELNYLVGQLTALDHALRALILLPGEASGENPTAVTHFPHRDLLHVYAHTVTLRAQLEVANVYLDELGGRIAGCALSPTMSAPSAEAQVLECYQALPLSVRLELDDTVREQTRTVVQASLSGAFAFAADFSDSAAVLQTVFEERFDLHGAEADDGGGWSWTPSQPSSGLHKWTYDYAGEEFYITNQTTGHSSDGTTSGYFASFDGRDYGSAEEAIETHRRRVYHETLMVAYVPFRLFLENWWQQLRDVGAVSGSRPQLDLDADVDALTLGNAAPGYEPWFTTYSTKSLDGTWHPIWDQPHIAQNLATLDSAVDGGLSSSARSKVISMSYAAGDWYALGLAMTSAVIDVLQDPGKQLLGDHERLIDRHLQAEDYPTLSN